MNSLCPICGRTVHLQPASSVSGSSASPAQLPPDFPFCSPRCRLVDLGRWLDGEYRIPGAPLELSDGAAPEDAPPETIRHSPRSSGAEEAVR